MKRRKFLTTLGGGTALGAVAGCTSLNLVGLGDSCPGPSSDAVLEFEAVESETGGRPLDREGETIGLIPSSERLTEVTPQTGNLPDWAAPLVEETDFSQSFLLAGQIGSSGDSSRIRFTGIERVDTDTVRSFSCIEESSPHDDWSLHNFVARVEKPNGATPRHLYHYHGETDNQTRMASHVGKPEYHPHPTLEVTPDSPDASTDPPARTSVELLEGFSPRSPAHLRIELTNRGEELHTYPIGGHDGRVFGDPILDRQEEDHYLLLAPHGDVEEFGRQRHYVGQPVHENVSEGPIEGYWLYRHVPKSGEKSMCGCSDPIPETEVYPDQTAAHEFLIIDPGFGGLVPEDQPFPSGEYRFTSYVGPDDSKWGFTVTVSQE